MLRVLCLALSVAALPAMAEMRVPGTASGTAIGVDAVGKQAAPAVVHIHAGRVVEGRRSPLMGDPIFEPFFREVGPARAGLHEGDILREGRRLSLRLRL